MKQVILFIFVLISGLSFADENHERIKKDLLSLQRRPSVEKVLNAFDGDLPAIANPSVSQNGGFWTEVIKARMPRAIAELEYAYPGAVWAALGRDAVAIIDVLEAFYLSVGQADRVTRIEASTATFNSSEAEFIKMLEQLGLPKDQKLEEMRPFIILDRTTYKVNSQSTTLISYIYRHYLDKKVVASPNDLFKKIAVVSSSSGQQIDPKIMGSLFANNKMRADGPFAPTVILRSPNLAYFTDQTHQEWHQTFAEIIQDENGRLGGRITGPNHHQYKENALWMMIEAYTTVSTPAFLNAVRSEAKKLGYDFDEHLRAYAVKYGKENQPHSSSAYVPPKPPEPTLEEKIEEAVEKIFHDNFAALYKEDKFLGLDVLYGHRLESVFVEAKRYGFRSLEEIFERVDAQYISGHADAMNVLQLDNQERSTEYERFISGYIRTFKHFEPYEGKAYFSKNAAVINESFRSHAQQNILERTLVYLSSLNWAEENSIISMRDYRRLTLFAFGYLQTAYHNYSPQLVSDGFRVLLRKRPSLYKILVERAEVFLTSQKQDGAAAELYRALVKDKVLPKPNECQIALKKSDDDAA